MRRNAGLAQVSNATQTVLAFPVSVKGVLVRDGKVLLLKNEREEWELPGGKLERGEDPRACVAREITEETGLSVTTGPILDSWLYHIREGCDVVIVTYGCHADGNQTPVLSHEHKEIGFFTQAEVGTLTMPAGYRRSIQSWFTLLVEIQSSGTKVAAASEWQRTRACDPRSTT